MPLRLSRSRWAYQALHTEVLRRDGGTKHGLSSASPGLHFLRTIDAAALAAPLIQAVKGLFDGTPRALLLVRLVLNGTGAVYEFSSGTATAVLDDGAVVVALEGARTGAPSIRLVSS